MQIESAINHILEKLRKSLPEYLSYHSLKHTKDVTKQALRIAKAEGVTNYIDLGILETAAAYHD